MVPGNPIQTEISLASMPAMAIGSSAELLVNFVGDQAKLRRKSFLSVNSKCSEIIEDKESPDFENVKSPSTEFTTSTVHCTPIEESVAGLGASQYNGEACDTREESKRYFV